MSDYLGELECVRCQTPQAEARASLGCWQCAQSGVHANVLPRYRPPGRDAGLSIDSDQPGLFRFRRHLPIAHEVQAVSLGEGGTPLIPAVRLGAELGLARLFLKDEAQNPTWSYKDRLAAVAITKARELGVDKVVVSSTGNAGAATAAYAAAAGMECIALTIASVPTTMKVLMQSFTPHVVAVVDPDDRWVLMRRLVEERGWVATSGFLSPAVGSNGFGVDGYKTLAFEIYRDLGRAPSVVVTPVAYGDALIGMHRGFCELVELGLAERVPRLIAVDPFGAYATALEPGADAVVEEQDTVAFSIAVTGATQQALRALRDSGGAALRGAADPEVLTAQQQLARTTGVYAEASAAMAVAAIPRLLDRGLISPAEDVVLINTSTGLKDVDATTSLLPRVPVIEPTLQALDSALATRS